MNVAIAIRTAVIKDNVLYVQAGAGIVADSVPKNEWVETQNKAKAILKASELVQSGQRSKKMIVMIDNYDSFTYNLVQYFSELGQEVVVHTK